MNWFWTYRLDGIFKWCGLALLLSAYTANLQGQTKPPDLVCAYKVGSDVKLEWGLQPDTCGPYYIYASQSKSGPYQVIDTITNPNQSSYIHAGANPNCPTNVWYYFMTSDNGCNGGPELHSDTLDNCDPEAPSIDYVTVNGPNIVEIDWAPSSSPETHAYIVFWDKLGNNTFVSIDTVYGHYNTNYIHDGTGPAQPPTPNKRSEQYTIASLDSCGNRGPLNEDAHKTIYLTDSIDRCASSVLLNWTKYVNWSGGVKNYYVHVSTNGGAYQQVAKVGSNTNSYTFTNFNDGDSLCFYIEAEHGNNSAVTSVSNISCVVVSVVQPPRFTYVEHVTVTPDTSIEVKWQVDPIADIMEFKVQRSFNGTDYEKVHTKDNLGSLTNSFIFKDKFAKPEERSYYYRVVSIDSCGDRYISTNYGKNILLSGQLAENFVNGLSWSNYEKWTASSVDHYNIYRKLEDTWVQIDVVGGNVNTYQDNITDLEDPDGIFCYQVEAVSTLDSISGGVNKSRSNIVCVTQYPSVYVPNAFAPNGHNSTFKPVLLYTDKSDYTMKIYNRWGQELFVTNDPNEGWDGRVGGKLMPQDAYFYVISFTQPDGSPYKTQGTVVLVH